MADRNNKVDLDRVKKWHKHGWSDNRIGCKLKTSVHNVTYSRYRLNLKPNFKNFRGEAFNPKKQYKKFLKAKK